MGARGLRSGYRVRLHFPDGAYQRRDWCAKFPNRHQVSRYTVSWSTGSAGNHYCVTGVSSLVEGSACMVLGQSLESAASAGVPWLCLVLMALEPAELQLELLGDRQKFRSP